MDYEKKYKRLTGVIKDLYTFMSNYCKEKVEGIIPELKESEDERMKEAAKHGLQHLGWEHINGIKIKDILAWLEKQGKKSNYNPYKATIESISAMVEKYAPFDSNLQDFYDNIKVKCKDAMEYDNTWLEKQSEQPTDKCKGCNNVKGCITCTDGDQWAHIKGQKPVDKVEPKFKIGDWIVHDMPDGNKVIRLIIGMTDKSYILNGEDSNTFYFNDLENDYHLWTIQDAKDGDVLCCENGWTCIFKALDSDISFSSYCFMDSTGWFCETGSESHTLEKAFIKAYSGNIYPATKKQRNLLFQKMKEAGYEWDFEKKELRKIDTRENLILDGDLMAADCMIVEQKPTWSEEDEYQINTILHGLDLKREIYRKEGNQVEEERYNTQYNWLKSLKFRFN